MTPTQKHLYRLLCEKADAGDYCPRNSEICERLGLASQASASAAMSLLELDGHLSIERSQNQRRVTITATGQVIESAPAKFKQRFRTEKQHKSRGPDIDADSLTRVYRDPCFYCNTRGDIGCEHQPLEAVQ